MALALVSLLDEVAFKQEWAERVQIAMNQALGSLAVAPGYNVMVSIARRNYILDSTDGQLKLTAVAEGLETRQALARASCRLVVEPEAVKKADELEDWGDRMLARRKLRIEGSGLQLQELDRELAAHFEGLRAKLESVRPGPAIIKKAYAELEGELDESDAAPDPFKEAAAAAKEVQVEAWEADIQPLLGQMTGWVLFAALSNMTGNIGQGNYTAANTALEVLNCFTRTTNWTKPEAISFMWGAVGGLGMRWKAFASQDMLLQVENSAEVLMTIEEAQECLRHVVMGGVCPESVCANKWDAPTRAAIGEFRRHPDPWGFGKGKGGGDSFWPEQEVADDFQAPGQPQRTGLEGRRVKIDGLALNTELNQAKGTLLEEVQAGVWRVLLDGGLGEKLLKVENMLTLSGKPLADLVEARQPLQESSATPAIFKTVPTATTALQPSEAYSIAGAWDDWMPQDMEWDESLGCLVAKVSLDGRTNSAFSVNRGKAMGKPWRVRPKQQWTICGGRAGLFQIQLFLADSRIRKVEWVKLD